MQQIPGQPGLHSKNVKDKQTKKTKFNHCMKIKEFLHRKKNQLSEKATEWGGNYPWTLIHFNEYILYINVQKIHTHTHTLQTTSN